MLEHFEDGHDDARSFAQDSERLFAAAAEDAFDASHAEPVDQVLGEAERDKFRDRESLALCTRALVNVPLTGPAALGNIPSTDYTRGDGSAHLIERDTQVDVDELAACFVHENV